MRKQIKPKIISKPRRNGKLRPKDEAFCQAIALQGLSGAAAYRAHIALGAVTQGTAQESASRLIRHPEIAARIRHIRASNELSIEERLGAGREQAVRYLVDAWQTPLSEIDETSPLAQSVKKRRLVAGDAGDEQGEWETEEVKSVSKLDALEKLAKMAGWYPSQQGGGVGALPAITINLGALYSPAQALGEAPRTLRAISAQVRTSAS